MNQGEEVDLKVTLPRWLSVLSMMRIWSWLQWRKAYLHQEKVQLGWIRWFLSDLVHPHWEWCRLNVPTAEWQSWRLADSWLDRHWPQRCLCIVSMYTRLQMRNGLHVSQCHHHRILMFCSQCQKGIVGLSCHSYYTCVQFFEEDSCSREAYSPNYAS